MRPRDTARHLRHTPTDAESILWNELRNRRLDGYKFRRQYPVAGFIADFCCPQTSLIVEVDGPIHRTRPSADTSRDDVLQRLGFRVLHLTNRQVEHDLPAALTRIRHALASSPSHPPSDPPLSSVRWRGGQGVR